MPATPHNPLALAFGVRLRQLRTQHGISQDQLARRTGIHPTAIGRLEHGRREPTLKTILRLAHGLNLHPTELLTLPSENREGQTQ